jgi:hypothetical protein
MKTNHYTKLCANTRNAVEATNPKTLTNSTHMGSPALTGTNALAPARRPIRVNRMVNLTMLLSVCMLVSSPGWGFTLYNSKMKGYDPQFNFPVPPAADYDATPNNDFSDCINAQNDHWAWPVNAGQITITYWFDSSFDNLFTGPNAATMAAGVKAQIVQAMNQWMTASSTGYGQWDSYARASSLNLNVTTLSGGPQNQTVTPFMDVRSATLHELGHILGFAHCDQGITAGRNYAYFDPSGNRGIGFVGSGALEPYGTPPNTLDLGQNYYIDYLFGVVGFMPAGTFGQEVMSQYSVRGLFGGMPIFGRQPGEINHILAWDELDGYYFLYGTSKLVFTPAANEGIADLVIYGGPIFDLVTGLPDTVTVCQGLPLGVPKNPSNPAQGIVIQQAQIYYNNASMTQIGYATAGFNFDVQANTGWNIYSVALDVVGTENLTLAGPTFDNFGWYQGNPNYQFQPGVPFAAGNVNLKDEMGVRWSHSPSPIPPGPAGPVIHVGVTPDVFDWTDFSITATFFDNHVPVPNQMTIPTAPVHIFSAAAVAGGFADAASPDERITGACLTSIALTNSVGVSGLAVTGPATTNSTVVFNLQVADVTGMGLTLSNLSSIGLAELQQSNKMIAINNFGTNTLGKGEQFVVIMQGSTNYLPANIVTNHRYAMALSLSNLVNRELFAVVTSANGNALVQNYSLLNSPSTVATVQSNLNLTRPEITSARTLGSGAFQLEFSSTNNPPLFYVLSTTNVALPPADWTVRGRATNTAPGQFQFTDTKASSDRRFYRIRWMLSAAQ